jgi:hypothetical protein
VYILHMQQSSIIQSKNKVLHIADGYMQEEEEALANKSRCDSQHQRCSLYTSRAGDSNLLGLIPSDVPRRRKGGQKKNNTKSLKSRVCVCGATTVRGLTLQIDPVRQQSRN